MGSRAVPDHRYEVSTPLLILHNCGSSSVNPTPSLKKNRESAAIRQLFSTAIGDRKEVHEADFVDQFRAQCRALIRIATCSALCPILCPRCTPMGYSPLLRIRAKTP